MADLPPDIGDVVDCRVGKTFWTGVTAFLRETYRSQQTGEVLARVVEDRPNNPNPSCTHYVAYKRLRKAPASG